MGPKGHHDADRAAKRHGHRAFETILGRAWAPGSARWIAAAVLHDGDWWLEQSSAEHICDEAVGAFARERVSVSAAPDLGHAGVRLRVELEDGRALAVGSDHAPGDPSRPLDRGQIEQKLRRATPSVAIESSADELIDRFRALDGEQSVAPLIRSLRRELER